MLDSMVFERAFYSINKTRVRQHSSVDPSATTIRCFNPDKGHRVLFHSMFKRLTYMPMSTIVIRFGNVY